MERQHTTAPLLPRAPHTLHIIPQRDQWQAEQRRYQPAPDISEHGRCSGLPVEETANREEGL